MSTHRPRHRKPARLRAGLAITAALALLAGIVTVATSPVTATSGLSPIELAQVQKANCEVLRARATSTAQRTRATQCITDQTRIIEALTATPSPSPTGTPTPAPSPTATPSPTGSPSTTPTTPAPTTPPPTATTPPTTPVPNSWPGPTNTGPHGTLTPRTCPAAGYIPLNTPGQVLQDASIVDCEIDVSAPNVVIRNIRLVTTNPEMWAIHLSAGATGTVISDVEVYGHGRGTDSVQYAVYLVDSASVTITRANLHHCADCVQGEHVVLTDSWLHDFANIPGISHVDGFQCNSTCDGTVIRHNRIHVDHGQTGAVSLFQDFGIPRNVLIEGNWLSGGGWTIYGGAGTRGTPTNIVIRDNWVDAGQYGWMAYWNPAGVGNIATGNTTSTGVPLTP